MVEPVFLVSVAVLLLLGFFAFRRARRTGRLVRDILHIRPTSIAQAGNDLVQVRGVVRTTQPISSAFQQRPCAYYAYRIEDVQPEPKKPRRLAVGKDWADLFLEDETGTAVIHSRPALIRAPHEHIEHLGKLDAIPERHAAFFEAAGINARHMRRFTNLRVVEYTLEDGDEVFVLGTARPDEGRKVFYRARHSPLAVTPNADTGLVPGLKNELLLFSVAAVLLVAFALVFFGVALA